MSTLYAHGLHKGSWPKTARILALFYNEKIVVEDSRYSEILPSPFPLLVGLLCIGVRQELEHNEILSRSRQK